MKFISTEEYKKYKDLLAKEKHINKQYEKSYSDWREYFKNEEINQIYAYCNTINQKLFNITGHKPTPEQQKILNNIKESLENTMWILKGNKLIS